MTTFDYAEMTTRNMGFVTPEEQRLIADAAVFIPGVGGMGGSAFAALVRAGVGSFVIADLDGFEISNLNRQAFANLDTIGTHKAVAAAEAARRINPEVVVRVMDGSWTGRLDEVLSEGPVVVNGMDDAAAGVHLYRRAAAHDCTVVDAYASPLPSVTVVRPEDPRPETRLGYPTVGVDWTLIDDGMRRECMMREVEYVLVHSSSHEHVDLEVAAEIAAGRRPRFSFSTMVTLAGTMMAEEALRIIMGRPGGADHRGHFLNLRDGRIERPRSRAAAALRGVVARRMLARMTA